MLHTLPKQTQITIRLMDELGPALVAVESVIYFHLQNR